MPVRSRVGPLFICCIVGLVVVLGAGAWWLAGESSPLRQDAGPEVRQTASQLAGVPVEGRLTTSRLELTEHDLAGRDRAQFTKTVRNVERDYALRHVSTDAFTEEHSAVATWAADAEVRVYRLESRETTTTYAGSQSVVPTGSEYMVVIVSDVGLKICFQ